MRVTIDLMLLTQHDGQKKPAITTLSVLDRINYIQGYSEGAGAVVAGNIVPIGDLSKEMVSLIENIHTRAKILNGNITDDDRMGQVLYLSGLIQGVMDTKEVQRVNAEEPANDDESQTTS